jgi:hypothetical protein
MSLAAFASISEHNLFQIEPYVERPWHRCDIPAAAASKPD